jgi:hypothetical protein
MKIDPIASVLYSELVLSLYPLLIKDVSTNLFTQILARFGVFSVLALLFGSSYDFKFMWADPYEASVSLLHNMMNMGHIFVSYLSFKNLPIGTSIALFYLYPIFNLIFGSFLFGESLSIISILLIIVAFYGTYLIATSYRSKEKDDAEEKKYNFGVIMGLLSAFTETMLFLFVRSNTDAMRSPFYTVNHIYLIGLVGLLAYGVSHPTIVDHSSTNWLKLIGFNAILGFTGYIARFYSISNIPTVVFSLMSFIGVAFGYAWTILFTKDKITTRALLGGGLIAGSIAALRYFDL